MKINDANDLIPVKAEIISELAFQRNSRTGMFSYGYQCKIMVRVLKMENTVTVHMKSEYISSTGTYGTPDYVEGYTKTYPYVNDDNFTTLKNAGISINYDDVIEAYEKELLNIKKIEEEEKAEKERQLKIEKGLRYDKSWIWGFIKKLESPKNKKLKSYDYQIKPCDKTAFINGSGKLYVEVHYKGIYTEISLDSNPRHEADKYTYQNATRIVKRDDGSEHIKTIPISDYKHRYSVNQETIVLKFLKEYDEYVDKNNKEKESKEKQEKERTNRKQFIEEIAGIPVEIKQEYVPNTWNRSKPGHYIHRYYINLNKRDIRVDYSTKRGKWINEESRYEDLGKEYSIGSLGGLKADQFKGIIKILSNGEGNI